MIVLDPVAITGSKLLSTNVPLEYPAWVPDGVYGPTDYVTFDTDTAHDVYHQLQGVTKTVVITVGSPAVVVLGSHGLAAGQPVKLTTTGALPVGITAGATYYVVNPTSGNFQLATTPGGSPISGAGSQSGTHTLTINSIGQQVTNASFWVRVGVRNAWKMFDDVNNTLTENADSISITLRPGGICGGVYLGGVDGGEVEVTMTDDYAGVVYHSTTSLIMSTSGGSFFNWYFNQQRRRNYFVALDLPRYYNAAITITVRRPGKTVRCGMVAVGRLTTVGLSLYGMGIEDKDWSSTRFNIDGTSETTVRGYSKILTVDVMVENDQIASQQEILRAFRQRNMLYIGAVEFGHSIVYGKYESLKSIMPNVSYSTMAMKINGVV